MCRLPKYHPLLSRILSPLLNRIIAWRLVLVPNLLFAKLAINLPFTDRSINDTLWTRPFPGISWKPKIFEPGNSTQCLCWRSRRRRYSDILFIEYTYMYNTHTYMYIHVQFVHRELFRYNFGLIINSIEKLISGTIKTKI